MSALGRFDMFVRMRVLVRMGVIVEMLVLVRVIMGMRVAVFYFTVGGGKMTGASTRGAHIIESPIQATKGQALRRVKCARTHRGSNRQPY